MATSSFTQRTPPTSNRKRNSQPTSPRNSPAWRCTNNERLHRKEDRACTQERLDSPVIDTPSKRLRWERQLASRTESQGDGILATPSRPQRPSHARSKDGISGSFQSQGDEDDFQFIEEGSNSTSPAADDNASANSSRTASIAPEHPLSEPSLSTSLEDPLPLGPIATVSQHVLSTLPDPTTPRSSHVGLLHANLLTPDPTPTLPKHSTHFPSPSPSSREEHAQARISRLLLRTKINNLHHQASHANFVLTTRKLREAEDVAQRERKRRREWKALCLVLLLVFICFCWCGMGCGRRW